MNSKTGIKILKKGGSELEYFRDLHFYFPQQQALLHLQMK